MNRTLPLALLTLGTLAGCTRVVEVHTPTTPAPATTTAETPTVTDAEVEALATHMVASVHALLDRPVYATDEVIIQIAVETCRALDRGTTLAEIATLALDTAQGDPDMEDLFSAITVVAIMELCPQHEHLLRAAGDLV